jgi:glutamate-1-semialdehyde 2,1-aminomutase
VAAYETRFPRSGALMQRAAEVMPGGNTRTTAHYPPFPLAIDRADGPFLWDADGNRLIDLLLNYTSLVHGHRYPPVMDAVATALERGTAWPAASPEQVDLAAALCRRIPSVDRVRFCNSGTEAGMLAVRIARRATGRRLLLKATEGYHGSYDELDSGPETLKAPYGDRNGFLDQIERHAADLAAVVLEPVRGSTGVISPPPEFLRDVAAASRAAGAVFVLDEVITLRLGVGGAQVAAGVDPDLTMMAKLIGGGFPVGAVGGRADLLEHLDPHRSDALQHSGTYNGNLVTCAAGYAAVTALTAEAIDRMAGHGRVLAESLEASAARHAVPVAVTGSGSLVNLHGPESLLAEIHLLALEHGLYIAPRGMMALCTVITDALLGEICDRFDAVFADAARLG